MRRAKLLLVTTALSVGSCVDDASPKPTVAAEWHLSPEPVTRIGADAARAGHALHLVVGATVLSSGAIVLADAGSSELRWFDRSGDLLRTVGRTGDGPGEWRYLRSLGRGAGDTLVVYSRDPGLSWIDEHGLVVRQDRVGFEVVNVACRIAQGGVYLGRNGLLYIPMQDNPEAAGCAGLPEGLWQQTALLESYAPGTETRKTLGRFRGAERNGRHYRAYGGDLLMDVRRTLLVANSRDSHVLRLTLEGDTVTTIPIPIDARPTRAGQRSVVERTRTRPDGSVERLGSYAYPDHFPRLGRVILDAQDRAWLMEYPDIEEPVGPWAITSPTSWAVGPDGASWILINDDGGVLGRLRTPSGFYVLEIGADYALGLSRGPGDVQVLEMYTIVR